MWKNQDTEGGKLLQCSGITLSWSSRAEKVPLVSSDVDEDLLVRDCVVTQLLLALADARSMALRQIGEAVSAISPELVSVVAFGSFARGEADAHSDFDLVVVRADDVDDDDEGWAKSIDAWRRQVRALTGNDVEIIEATASGTIRKLRGRSELWRNIKRDGIVVYGRAPDELAG